MVPEIAYIYGLFDPRIPDVIWYVGKANNYRSRLSYHKRDAKLVHKRSPVQEWIVRLQDEGIQPKLRLLETCPFSEWKKRERAAIALYRNKNLLLLNKLDGGNGTGVGGIKEFCECGEKRVRLYPTDSSLRCPICRKQQRKTYESKWHKDHAESQKKFKATYYLANKEKIDMAVSVKKKERIAAKVCIRCGVAPVKENRRACEPCLKIQASKAEDSRARARARLLELNISFC